MPRQTFQQDSTTIEIPIFRRERGYPNISVQSDRTIADTTSRLEEVLTELLNEWFIEIQNVAEVKYYLRSHEDILDLVCGVCKGVREHFPSNTQLSLEVYHDPEMDDEYLTLYVRQEEYETDILRKIKVILSGYSDFLKGKSGWFLVTTDFQPPK
jgi:hypothetical protein